MGGLGCSLSVERFLQIVIDTAARSVRIESMKAQVAQNGSEVTLTAETQNERTILSNLYDRINCDINSVPQITIDISDF